MSRYRNFAAFALITVAALGLTACGSGDPADAGPAAQAKPAGAKGRIPTTDVVSAVKKDEAAAALLPKGVRESGTLTLASSVGNPPGAVYLADGRTVAGQDIDFADAVAKVLGLKLKRQVAAFEVILPALDSGKYDLGTGNFGVTDERRKTIDFVTYINDGQGFAVREDSELGKVTELTQLCGLKVATGAGTTFEATLEKNKGRCAEAGKKAYSVQTYSEQGALWISLRQGRSDVVMSTINGLRYAVAQQPGLRFLNEFHRLDVGFAFKKGTPLAPAFQAAVNDLKKDGTYDRILAKWGTGESAIASSQISPPNTSDPVRTTCDCTSAVTAAVAAVAPVTALAGITAIAAVTVAVAAEAFVLPPRPGALVLLGAAHLAGAAEPGEDAAPGEESTRGGRPGAFALRGRAVRVAGHRGVRAAGRRRAVGTGLVGAVGRVVAAVGAARRAEGPVHGLLELVGEQDVRQPPVDEVDLAQGEPDAVHRVVGQAPGLGQVGAGRRERVPGARRGVGRLVLHGVQEVREPPEQTARLGQRLGVVRPSGEYGRVREGRRGGRLGRLGDREQGGARSRERLDRGLPVDRVDQDRRVEPEGGAGAGARPVPARGNLAGRQRHRPALQQAVPVGHVVADLRRGQDQRDGRGEPGALALGDRRRPHRAQRTGPGGAPASRAALDLSLRQNRDDQPVVVGHDPGELPVVGAKCQAEAAEMGHPLGPQALGEPMRAGPDDSEHDAPPGAVGTPPHASFNSAAGIVSSDPFTRTPAPSPAWTEVHILYPLPVVQRKKADDSPHLLHQSRHESPARRLSTWRGIRIMDDHRGAEREK